MVLLTDDTKDRGTSIAFEPLIFLFVAPIFAESQRGLIRPIAEYGDIRGRVSVAGQQELPPRETLSKRQTTLGASKCAKNCLTVSIVQHI